MLLCSRHFLVLLLCSDERFFVDHTEANLEEIEHHAVRTYTFDGWAIVPSHLCGLLFSQNQPHLQN